MLFITVCDEQIVPIPKERRGCLIRQVQRQRRRAHHAKKGKFFHKYFSTTMPETPYRILTNMMDNKVL